MKSLLDKFKYAAQGLIFGFKDYSIKLQCFFFVVAVVFGFVFELNVYEWCILLLTCCIVVLAEFVNSVIEKIMDFIQPEYDERVKAIKDMAAGFVLFASIVALLIGMILFGGKLI